MTAEQPQLSSGNHPVSVSQPVLHVCVTCRRGGPATAHPPGAQLLEHLQTLLDAEQQAGATSAVQLRSVACLAACDQGCTAAIAMEGRWTWLLGHLGPEKADDLLVYARLYAASSKGTVMPSRRPASLANMVLGRVPALLYNEQEKP